MSTLTGAPDNGGRDCQSPRAFSASAGRTRSAPPALLRNLRESVAAAVLRMTAPPPAPRECARGPRPPRLARDNVRGRDRRCHPADAELLRLRDGDVRRRLLGSHQPALSEDRPAERSGARPNDAANARAAWPRWL